MLKFGEANPLNVFGLRQLSHCPPHFVEVKFDIKTNLKKITDWVYENLEGRFYAGDAYTNSNGRTSLFCCVAFEEPGEASYFALLLDKVNSH